MHSLLPLLLHRSCHFALDVPDSSILLLLFLHRSCHFALDARESSLLPDALSMHRGDAAEALKSIL